MFAAITKNVSLLCSIFHFYRGSYISRNKAWNFIKLYIQLDRDIK